MIQELCRKLRDKRKELGYSLEYTVEKTKLHPSMIKDIESGNLGVINPTYLKGFLKIYASFLGVATGDALDEIPVAVQQPKKHKKSKIKERTNFLERLAQAFKKVPPDIKRRAVIILAAVVALWLLIHIGRLTVRAVTKLFARKSEQTTSQPLPSAPVTFDASQELMASLTAKDKCFLKVIVDGKLLFEGILEEGVRETWQAKKEIELKISDGSAVDLEVNGKPIPTLTSIRRPIKSLKITPSGISVDK
jgi:cytoskeletal protein RodZ